jgi:hypothetical protein
MKLLQIIDTIAHVLCFLGAWLLYYRVFTTVAPRSVAAKMSMHALKVCMLSFIGLHLMGIFEVMNLWLNLMSYCVLPLIGIWIHHGHQFHLKEELHKEIHTKKLVK